MLTSTKFYLALFIAAPIPRKPLSSEKSYRTIEPGGNVTNPKPLPCWQDKFDAKKEAAQQGGDFSNTGNDIEEAEIFLSLVVPAYNEQDRLNGMLEEAVEYLQLQYSTGHGTGDSAAPNGAAQITTAGKRKAMNGPAATLPAKNVSKGWEILIVSDGSTDRTAETALAFARKYQLCEHSANVPDSGTTNSSDPPQKPCATVRVIILRENRGKGGAVIHGMRHVRGKYVIFADADGASKFEDLGKLVEACQGIEDAEGRGVAVGSRAHLVGSEAVVKVRRRLARVSPDVLTYLTTAFLPPQSSHALLSFTPSGPHAPCNCSYKRHPMRIQTILSFVLAVYNTVHALRRLDLRCRDVDAR